MVSLTPVKGKEVVMDIFQKDTLDKIEKFYDELWKLHEEGALEYPTEDEKVVSILNAIDVALGR